MLIKKGNAPLISSSITARSNTQFLRKEYGRIIAQFEFKLKRRHVITIRRTPAGDALLIGFLFALFMLYLFVGARLGIDDSMIYRG